MKYDVFISYKRLDKDKVFKIKDFIERKTGHKCWIDLDGIESDAQFANVIIRAINDCELFLFMYSHNHAKIDDYDKDWTVKEINFAQKKNKRIVFINIDKASLTDWFELFFGTKQQVDASSDFAMKKLCDDIARWLKKDDENSLEIKRQGHEIRAKQGNNKRCSGTINGHKYVDLGLPSGLKWATCNVGANKPEEYGDYFAWGEIETKNEYDSKNYRYGRVERIKGFLGIVKNDVFTCDYIGDDISGNIQYDAATANWGGTWRMPTEAELQELENNCEWDWITQNGVNGYKVTGPNDNHIFLPAAGHRYWSSLYDDGDYGSYWSSTPHESRTNCAYFLQFHSGFRSVFDHYRYDGYALRPITE